MCVQEKILCMCGKCWRTKVKVCLVIVWMGPTVHSNCYCACIYIKVLNRSLYMRLRAPVMIQINGKDGFYCCMHVYITCADTRTFWLIQGCTVLFLCAGIRSSTAPVTRKGYRRSEEQKKIHTQTLLVSRGVSLTDFGRCSRHMSLVRKAAGCSRSCRFWWRQRGLFTGIHPICSTGRPNEPNRIRLLIRNSQFGFGAGRC